MSNTDEQMRQFLKELNASIKDLNVLLEELIRSRQNDKLNWLKAFNGELRELNTLLTEILESRKKMQLLMNYIRQPHPPIKLHVSYNDPKTTMFCGGQLCDRQHNALGVHSAPRTFALYSEEIHMATALYI